MKNQLEGVYDMNVMALLDYLQEEVERANKVPFSENAMVDREKLLNIINDVRVTLPNELMEAETIRNQRAQIIEDAQREAHTIVEEAQAQARQLVEENAVTQQAYAQAQEIVERAQNGAREVRRSANEYVEDVLSEMEGYITRNLEMVRANREQMRGR
ncbi:MAG: hypothetical protein J6A48_03015 [Clostridia bacterium]|jgi:vacuolar-type H+-ATPase subunit H|nr:hypothetical protein [Clostridia bacterium]